MLKALFVSMVLLFSLSDGTNPDQQNTTPVWICTSPNAYAFHSISNCSRCSYELKQIPIEKAIQIGRRACLKCYKSNKDNPVSDARSNFNVVNNRLAA
jgi:hypothetical protein